MNAPFADPPDVLVAEPGLCLHDLVHSGAVVGEPRLGERRTWTAREVKILRDQYGEVGLEGCLPLLRGRMAGAIYQKAGLLKLRSPAAKAHPREQRWFASEQIDATVRRLYPASCEKGVVAALARRVGRPRWWVSKRAVQLGVVPQRRKEPPWSAAEDALLEERAHQDPISLQRVFLRHGFRRTPVAIAVRLQRAGFDRTDPDRMTGRDLASAMGVDSTTVCGWIAKGWLRAHRSAADGPWRIHRRDVARFVVETVSAIDLRKVDKVWFVDLLVEHGGTCQIAGDTYAALGLAASGGKILAALMVRDVVSRDQLFQVLYADRTDDAAPSIKIIDVHLCKLRSQIRRLGATVETVWGEGYRMPQDSKALIAAALDTAAKVPA